MPFERAMGLTELAHSWFGNLVTQVSMPFERAMGLTDDTLFMKRDGENGFQCPLSGLWDLRTTPPRGPGQAGQVSMPFERAMGLTGLGKNPLWFHDVRCLLFLTSPFRGLSSRNSRCPDGLEFDESSIISMP